MANTGMTRNVEEVLNTPPGRWITTRGSQKARRTSQEYQSSVLRAREKTNPWIIRHSNYLAGQTIRKGKTAFCIRTEMLIGMLPAGNSNESVRRWRCVLASIACRAAASDTSSFRKES